MKTHLVTIFPSQDSTPAGLKSILSLQKFIAHLQELIAQSSSIKKEMLTMMFHKFQMAINQYGPIDESNFKCYQDQFYMIYNLMVPLFQEEQKSIWGLSFPVSGNIFYGTDTFYEFLEKEAINSNFAQSVQQSAREDLQLEFIYSLILERLYGFPVINQEPLVYELHDPATGLPAYYTIQVDNTFVDVKPLGDLPEIDYEKLKNRNINPFKWSEFLTIIPLDNFQIEGFSIITLQSNATEQVLENLKNIVIKGAECETRFNTSQLEVALQTLTNNAKLRFNLLPLVQLNGEPVIDPALAHDSILFHHVISKNDGSPIVSLVKDYLRKPYIITYNIFSDNNDLFSNLVKELVKLEITSYACLPIFYNKEAVGLLEIHTEATSTTQINKVDLIKLRPATTLLAQLAYDLVQDSKGKLDEIIKDHFTSIQPSVQWKFNKAAWHHLLNRRKQLAKEPISDIQFNDVYPLYGAIDIRDSTYRQNKAQCLDLKIQLQLLEETLSVVWSTSHWEQAEKLLGKCKQLQTQLDIEQIDTLQFIIGDFLKVEVASLFANCKGQYPSLKETIEKYEKETDPITGFCFSQRRAFETSIGLINQTITAKLEEFNRQIQSIYPSYFEKFRTDGIEYDIYVGQSIAPTQKFSAELLERIQLLQLSYMAAIAKATYAIGTDLPVKMHTTQIIYINSNSIDINFRVDERRFDVEGAYNVRYQVIKKRIDKALIKDRNERLTQPGRIALVYLHESSIKHYYAFIKQLQNAGILLDDLEHLELQEVQGVSGLKALRVGVNLGIPTI